MNEAGFKIHMRMNYSKSRNTALQLSNSPSVYQFYFIALQQLVVLSALFFVLSALLTANSLIYLNSIGPMCLSVICGTLAWRLVEKFPESLWTPMFWLPVQCAVFFGVGPLVEVFGNSVTADFLSNYSLAVDDVKLLGAHKLSILGTTLVFVGYFFHTYVRRRQWKNITRRVGVQIKLGKNKVLLAIGFVIVGFAIKYGYVEPARHSGRVAVGLLVKFSLCLDVGFALCLYLMLSKGITGKLRTVRLVFYTLWPVHLFLSFLSFSKSQVVIALLLPLLGAHLGTSNRKVLMVGTVFIALVYSTLQPLVQYGRGAIYQNTQTIGQASYTKRMELVGEFIAGRELGYIGNIAARQSWWTRLSFAGNQASAMDLYERGYSSNSLKHLPYYFIPRVIWPGKPVITSPGRDFNELVTGRTVVSHMPATMYGDLYWQMGWIGLVLGAPVIGYIFSALSLYALKIVKTGEIIMMPVVMIILAIGMQSLIKYVFNGLITPLTILATLIIGIRVFKSVRKTRSL